MRILLRKIDGVFGATIGNTGARVSLGSQQASSMVAGFGALSVLMLPLLLVLTVLALLLAVLAPALIAQSAHHTAAVATGPALLLVGRTEVKEIVDKLSGAFEQFKNANDERLAQIEARGYSSAEVEANTNRANADITKLQGELADVRAALRDVETTVARPRKPGDSELDAKATARARQFLASQRGVAPHRIADVTPDDFAAIRAYDRAFDNYLVAGVHGLSGEDMQALNAFRPKAAMQTNSDPAGGYLVSNDRSGRIVQLIYETTPLRQLATIKTTSKDIIEGGLDLDDVAGGWVGETEARPETTTPQVGEWRIVMGEVYANPRLTQKQIDDSDTDVGGWMEKKTADKLSRLENTKFVSGDGLKGPRGFLSYNSGTNSKSAWGKIQQIGTGTSGAFAAAPNGGDVLINTVASMKTSLRAPDSAWLMSRLTVQEVRKLKDNYGGYIWQPDFSVYSGGSLVGYGVVEGEDMPQIAANSLSIAFANWKEAYVIYDHVVGMRTLRDPFTVKGSVLFYTTKRTGGDVQNFDAIKLVKFG